MNTYEGLNKMNLEKIEEARIKWAIRHCQFNNIPIYSAEECLEIAFKRFNRLAVAWSGGKCSTIIVHMAIQHQPDIPVIFNNTGVEYPETIHFINQIKNEWKLNLHVTKPIKSFWQCINEYGFPQFRGKYSKTWSRAKPACCYFLKEVPAKQIYHELNLEAVYDGIRVCESRARMFSVKHSQFQYEKRVMQIWKIHPIMFWDAEKLNQYIQENGIPVNPIYKEGLIRLGCMPCTGYSQWKQTLSKIKPKLYQKLMKMKGEPTLWEFYQDEDLM